MADSSPLATDRRTNDWFCAGVQHQPQQDGWCVPVCMSMLSAQVVGEVIPARNLASEWGQQQGRHFDAPSMFGALKRYCLSNRFRIEVDFAGQAQRKDWQWLLDLRRPALLAFDRHAVVCVGARRLQGSTNSEWEHCYAVLDPGSSALRWRRFPACATLAIDFAIAPAVGWALAHRLGVQAKASTPTVLG